MSDLDEEIMLTREEEIGDIAADLVSIEQNYQFISRLFSLEAGKWLDVFSACADIPIARDRLDKVLSSSGMNLGSSSVNLFALWMDYPEMTSDEVEGDKFVVIFFFTDLFHWSRHAVFNKDYFIERWAEIASKA